ASFICAPSAATLVLPIFVFTAPPTTDIYTLSLHDALPISTRRIPAAPDTTPRRRASTCSPAPSAWSSTARRSGSSRSPPAWSARSEEHTSELQSRFDLVCRLLLEKKKQQKNTAKTTDNHIE